MKKGILGVLNQVEGKSGGIDQLLSFPGET